MSSAQGCGSGCREGLGSHQQVGDPRRTCSQRERRDEGGALTEHLRSRELREETGPQKQEDFGLDERVPLRSTTTTRR